MNASLKYGRAVYVLGAGFSKPAGLPLGSELLSAIKILLSKLPSVYSTVFLNSIDEFVHYLHHAHGKEIDRDSVDIEEFLSFFEVNEDLALFGMATEALSDDTYVEKSFLKAIRYLTARTLYFAQNEATEFDLHLYREFAQRLEPGDIVITFNYDTLLEAALEECGRQFRYSLYTDRSTWYIESVLPSTEIVLLKMHGSIDWFERTNFENSEGRDGCAQTAESHLERLAQWHPVFCANRFRPIPVVDQARFPGDPLCNVYRIRRLGEYFDDTGPIPHDVPLLVSPSNHKLHHFGVLREMWRGVGWANVACSKLVFIGYSLPTYDEYARYLFYNFVRVLRSSRLFNHNIRVVDYRTSPNDIAQLMRSICFIDWDNTECYFDGFNMEAIKMIFDD